ncbi:hypothetical protein EDF56_106228 [Novosphingobium sp. PhB165]|uniref:hypothetical protein n=1 Tax=Novosphingobium sp. PhB165 TaxID=2485105 RepID=UPI0010471930|nr:hypothetical protein [Novosphingobium sp. PhB165]TCM17112.1 hypothetical protein EDF56_106228 [Novosphingobium sp. PhB165]
MEKVFFISVLIAMVAVPAAILTAIGAGIARLSSPVMAKQTLSIAAIGSVLPLAMFAYGLGDLSASGQGPVDDTISLGFWYLMAAAPSWIVCLLVAWAIIRRPARR